MVRTKKSKPSNRQDVGKAAKAAVQQPTPPTQDEDASDGSDVEITMERDPDEKDATEQELERLVFGDSAGFREGLRDFAVEEEEGSEEDVEESAAETGLEGLDDADVGRRVRVQCENIELTDCSSSLPMLALNTTLCKLRQ